MLDSVDLASLSGLAVWFGLAAGVVILGVGAFGCATSQSGSDSKAEGRDVPPEVTDRTTDDRSESARSLQPRVEVEFDAEELVGVDVEAYEATVRRSVQKCYTRRVYRGEIQSEGSMVYEVLVTRNGYVAGSERVSTDLHDGPLSSCIEAALGRMQFELRSPNKPVYRLFVQFQFRLETMVPSKPPI